MRTEARFLIAAALLHAAIPVAARFAPLRLQPLVARSSRAYQEIEVEVRPFAPLRPEEAPRAMARPPEEERDPERRLRPAREATTGKVTPPEPREPGPEPPPEAPTAPAPTAAPPDEYGSPPDPDGVAGVPGLGGAPVWQLPGVLPDRMPSQAAPTVAPPGPLTPTDKAGQLLRQVMQAKDKARGLDLPAAGTVATVVADEVRSSDTPETARATFEVSLSGAGQVLGVRATSMTTGAADVWARVARAAAARLAARKLAMPSTFAKGAKVYVSIVSAVKMPSGASSGGVHPSSSGFSFDVSDIGARPTRVVSSSFRVVAVD